jgi:hypothetical protein
VQPISETEGKKMTVEQVKERVEEIDACSSDYEGAHILEDDLYEKVLQAVAAGAENARELASEALKAKAIEFSRWYA